MPINLKDIKKNALTRVKEEVRGTFALTQYTVSAFVVLGIEEGIFRGVDKAMRETATKKNMTEQGLSNGKAAAYAKMVDGFMSLLVKEHGSPTATKDGVSQFWADWRDAETVSKRENQVLHLVQSTIKANKCQRIGDLCDVFGIQYALNKTMLAAQEKKAAKAATPKAVPEVTTPEVVADVKARHETPATVKAVPTWESVLADMLALSPEDQAKMVAGFQAVMASKARDVTPGEVKRIAA